jgi:hypothetical protein
MTSRQRRLEGQKIKNSILSKSRRDSYTVKIDNSYYMMKLLMSVTEITLNLSIICLEESVNCHRQKEVHFWK